MKRVIFVPVIHNLADLGSLAESVRAHYLERFGPAVWKERQRAVEKLWEGIRQALDALHLDYCQVRLYQDGLPVCGQESQIVEELAGAGSLNHQLLLELVRKGAVLVGTEDPQLLIREYQLQRRQLGEPGTGAPGGYPAASGTRTPSASPGESAELLEARDRFIAQRIAATLPEGQTGVLFLGAAHGLDPLRSAGITVETLHHFA